MIDEILDIKPQWLSVARRLQSMSKSEGLSIVSIRILCRADGTPISWTAPVQTKIEPKSELSALLLLTKE